VSEENTKLVGPDFSEGIPNVDLPDDCMILGQVGGEAVLLARSGGALFAIGAECSHYHGPLAEGVLVADTVRCPWHHACFSLRSGEALRAPALNPVTCCPTRFPTVSPHSYRPSSAPDRRGRMDYRPSPGPWRTAR